MAPSFSQQEIACQQVLLEDSSVFSLQSSLFPAALAAGLTPRVLLARYLTYIRRCTLTLIRPLELADGIEFRLLGSGISLISFLPPEIRPDCAILRICGGLLVQPRQCNRGELQFSVRQEECGVRVALQLSEFCPLILGSHSPSPLRYWLYRLTQAAIHRLVTIRFLVLLFRECAGNASPVRVVTAAVRSGRPV